MEEFVHEFRRMISSNRYKERLLIEEFKKGINEIIRRKLIEVEYSFRNIKQWYKRAKEKKKD